MIPLLLNQINLSKNIILMQQIESQKIQKNPEVNSDDEKQVLSDKTSGIEAILSNSHFSNKASSMYLNEVRSYLDLNHSTQIAQQLNSDDPNLMYSLNISALWLLLKDKLKKLSRVSLFEDSSDRIIIKFSMSFASVLCLNDAKEKIMEKERISLRKNIKEYVQRRLKIELSRKESILQEFNKSPFFNNDITEKLNLNMKQRETLRDNLVSFKFKEDATLSLYLRKILSFLQKSIQKKQKEIRRESATSSILLIESITREAYGVLLICTYLTIYTIFGDWIKILLKDKTKRLDKLLFFHLIEAKGFHILNRVLNDAPINVIAEEITTLQEIYYK